MLRDVSPVALVGWSLAVLAMLAALRAWRALTVRMEFVVRACHELRGPITAARLGLAFGARMGELSPARLRAIDLELGRSVLALDDLAAVRRARDSQRACGRTWEEVDVESLLADSVEAWRGAAAAGGVALTGRWFDGPGPVLGDRLRLAQAIGNLIANAIEHGGGAVEVRGSSHVAGVRVEVSDNGPGLPAPVALLARRARGGRGSRGRGLAIAARIAEVHGGRLAAAPAEQGARLVLELPSPPALALAQPERDHGRPRG